MCRRHMNSQHPLHWKEYSDVGGSETASYFDENAPVVHRNTVISHFGGSQVPVQLFVDKSIVRAMARVVSIRCGFPMSQQC